MFTALKNRPDFKRFFFGEGPKKAPYLLTHRRVYILPTKQGLLFSFLLFIMLLGSINYSNSLGYFLTFFLSSLLVVTIFHTFNNLLHLSIGPAICQPVFAKENSGFSLHIDNRQYQNRFSILAFTAKDNLIISDLKKNELNTIFVKHVYPQRGLIPLPRLTLETRFPFGLFRAWTFVELEQSQLVYPNPSSDDTLPLLSNGYSEGNKQRDTGVDDFKSLRTYAEGDPLQHIHWKNFARHHTLQTKEFTTTTSDEFWINWSDTTANNIEDKLSQLCKWLILADKKHYAYGLRLPNITIQTNSGKKHLNNCLKQLALYKTDST